MKTKRVGACDAVQEHGGHGGHNGAESHMRGL